MVMAKDVKIVTIPTQISPVYPDTNGRIFHKESINEIFRKRGYFRSNVVNKTTLSPIPIRFFIDVTDYCATMATAGNWNVDRQTLNTEEFTINKDISDEELSAMQIMYTNDRYYLNIPILRKTYDKHADYLSKCYANAICTELHAVEGVQMGANDILFFDIFPED